MYMKKESQKVETNEILTARTLLQFACTPVTTMHSCYIKMYTFSANQTRVFFYEYCYSLAFPRVSLFPGIKSRCTAKYIQDEHGEKRRKMDFQRARFLAGFLCM